MRRAGKSVKRRRWIALSAVLVAVGGCAQIVGIEEWRPYRACDEPDVDPDTCKPLPTCAECLYAQPEACETARMDCLVDPASVCNTVYTCAGPCEMAADMATCLDGCCNTSMGDMKFDAYLTCLCNDCKDECGKEMPGCDTFCDP